MTDNRTGFRDAIADAGLLPPDGIQADGNIHRFSTNGKASDTAGYYALHMDGVPAGFFGCWRTDIKGTWCDKKHQDLSPEERKAHAEKRKRMREQAQREQQAEYEWKAQKATVAWQNAKPVTDHAYLSHKQIQPHRLRVDGAGQLVIPLRDADGNLWGIQRINSDGKKKNYGRKRGKYYAIAGEGDTLAVVEGFATGASINEATGFPVAVAVDAGNLKPVAKTMREKFPAKKIIVCADNDQWTDGNPGITKATDAAAEVAARVVVPSFTDLSSNPTDFNDLHCLEGLAEVKRQISEGIRQPPLEGDGAVVVSLDSVQPQPVEWLWHERIALGKVTMIAGDPGLGKSLISLAIAANVTVGGKWPVDETVSSQGNVLLLSAEDSLSDTIRPRLDAAGADPSKVHALTFTRAIDQKTGQEELRSITLDQNLAVIEQQIQRIRNVRLLVIDPISAYMGDTDSHRNTDVRALLAPLSAMAERENVAVLAVSHLNKGHGGKAIYRVTGSLAFVAAARASYLVAKDPNDNDRRLVLPQKNNIASDKYGLAYTIQQHENGSPMLVWEPDPIEESADSILHELDDQKAPSATDEAAKWLKDLLKDNPLPPGAASNPKPGSIREQADKAGISWSAIQRAKTKAGVKSVKRGYSGEWVWQLGQPNDQVTPGPQGMSILEDDEYLGDSMRVSEEIENYEDLQDTQEVAQDAQDSHLGVVDHLGDIEWPEEPDDLPANDDFDRYKGVV